MSTKTLRKRISLVAVSALTFGLISAIAPTSAFAEATATTEITAVAIATPSGGRVGSPFTSAVTYTIAGDDTDTVTLRAILAAKPAGSTASVGFNKVGATAGPTGTITAASAANAQRLLGHSDPRVTMGIYTQVLDTEIDDFGLLLSKAAGL